MVELKAATCEECMVALKHRHNFSKFDVFGRIFELGHRLHIKIELPKRLLSDIPEWPSWTTLEMKFRDCWSEDHKNIHHGCATDPVMVEWSSDVKKMCQQGYMSPGHLPGTLNPITQERLIVIPPFIKAKIGSYLTSALESFSFKAQNAVTQRSTTTFHQQSATTAPVIPLSRERVSIILENPTDTSYFIDHFKITTRKNVSRIDEKSEDDSWQFVGTIPRGRLGFLLSFSKPSEQGKIISRVKNWIAQAQAISQRSTLSLQVLHDIQAATGMCLCIGENPLTAPSCFPSSWSNITEKEGWIDKEDDWKSVLVLLPTLQPCPQTDVCKWILENGIHNWIVVTNEETKIPSCLGPAICKIMDLDPEAPIIRKHRGVAIRQQWESKLSTSQWSIWCSLKIPGATQHQIRSNLFSYSKC